MGWLLAALQSAGWDLVEVPPADDCPDAVFVEDTVVVYRNVARHRPAGRRPSRKPEIVDVEKVIESLGCSMNRIHAPGTLDGGDVLKVGDTVYVGRGGRTNADGVRQLRAILKPLGATVIAVPLHKVLHLKSAVTALPDGSIIGYPPLVDDPRSSRASSPVPEESGAHVVLLGGGEAAHGGRLPRTRPSCSRTSATSRSRVDISEFQKLEGCVTCLSVRLRDVHTG